MRERRDRSRHEGIGRMTKWLKETTLTYGMRWRRSRRARSAHRAMTRQATERNEKTVKALVVAMQRGKTWKNAEMVMGRGCEGEL